MGHTGLWLPSWVSNNLPLSSAGIHWHFFVYVRPTAPSNCAQLPWVCQPYQTQLFPAKSVTYASTKKVISHQLKAATTESAIRCCRPFNPACSPVDMIQWGRPQVTKWKLMIFRKFTLHDSRVSIGNKSCFISFQRIESIPLSAKRNKHTASVEGYRGIIKTCTVPVSAPLGFIVNVKLSDCI